MTDTTSPPPKRYKSRKVVNHAIVANVTSPPDLYRTWPQLADDLGVDVQVVHDQINRLRKKGIIPKAGEIWTEETKPTARRANAARGKRGPSVLDESIQLEKALAGNMEPGERRETLAQIGRFGQEQNAIRAMEALNRMDEAKDRGIGPPPPLTDPDKITRLSSLDKAVGLELAFQAMEAAFGKCESWRLRAGGSDLVRLRREPLGRPAGGSDSDGEPGPHSGLVAAEDEEGRSAGAGREPDAGREHGSDAPGDSEEEHPEDPDDRDHRGSE